MHGDVGRFDRFARAYDLVMPRARVGKLQAGLAVADREITRALDVGGGPGRATRRLEIPERIVVDAAPGMLRKAREYGLATVAGDATRLPVQSASVDAVFVVDALHHIQDVDDVFAEAWRVLRPGGVLVVREFNPTTIRGRGLVLAERLVRFDSAFYTPERLSDAMSAAGLVPTVVERGFGYTVAGVRENERTK